MSTALAPAAMTAVLRSLLENGLAERGVSGYLGGDVAVSALPPDRIPIGAEERAQLNLFLYQVTPNTGLRASLQPGFREAGPRSGPASLAFDLHYLVTAYGAQDLHSEILLGHAIQILHETPVLTQERVQSALSSLAEAGGRLAPPALAALARSGLAEHSREIKITPHFLNVEEMSRIWSSLQARYRPSSVYRVSLVVLQPEA